MNVKHIVLALGVAVILWALLLTCFVTAYNDYQRQVPDIVRPLV